MNTNTNIASCTRRTVLACLGVAALMAVASDASAAPLTDAELGAFSAGTAKHIPNHALNTRIPQNATSPGFKLTMTRQQALIQVRTNGQVFIPPFSYKALGGSAGKWTLVDKQYPGGFVNVNQTDSMVRDATTIVYRNVNTGTGPLVDFSLTFNSASTPKTVLVTVTYQQREYDYYDLHKVVTPLPRSYTAKQLGGAFIYAIQPPAASGGAA
ncbi:MAG: hypothetical protein KIT84_30735 [Labilithrix sp.]|nr:hypothetical protein [Labilithrix sp.]MCW5815444.1 hypothetical protein [Labilithrix sp.]